MATHRVRIGRPTEDVYAVLANPELTGRWYPARVEEWWTSPPPHGLGSTRRARVRTLGRATENDAVVTAHDPPRLAAMKGLSRTAPFAVTLRFRPDGDGTAVEVESEFSFTGVMRLIGPLFVGAYERGWERGLANAKRMMEAGEL